MENIKNIEFQLMQIEVYTKAKIAEADIYFAGALNSSTDSGTDVLTFDVKHGLEKVCSTVS